MTATPATSDHASSVGTQYDQWAKVYDLFWRRYLRKTLPVLFDQAQLQAGERVLDVACGTGAFEQRVVESDVDVDLVGIDVSPGMIEQAQRKFEGADRMQFEQADAHDLPFDDDSFDVVVCASTFHYFVDPDTVLGEMERVLAPGGRVVILDWCRDFWTCKVMDVVLRYFDPAHHACYSLDAMRTLVDASPLRLDAAFRYRFDIVWGMMVVEAVSDVDR